MAKANAAATPNVEATDVSTVAAPIDEAVPMGLDYQPKYSLEQQAAQKAATTDWMRRQHPGRYTTLPNGQMVEVRGSVLHKYPGAKKTILMANPAVILKKEFRKPDFAEDMPRYIWSCRVDVSTSRRDIETANMHHRGDIRYVEMNEIDRHSPYAVVEDYPVPGPGSNVYVIMDTSILCEILNPNVSYEKYKYWTDLAMSNVAELPDVILGYGDTHIGDKTTTSVAMKNARQGS